MLYDDCLSEMFSRAVHSVYQDRLKVFALESLRYSRTGVDLVLGFEIVHELCDVRFYDIFEWGPLQSGPPNSFQLARRHYRNNGVLNSFAFRILTCMD